MKRLLAAVLGLTGMLALVGCQGEGMVTETQPDLRMSASHKTVLEGETVTFTTQTTNTLGRGSEIQWRSSGGHDFQTSADNRVAQVTFNEPGTYTVSALLLSEGNLIRTQTATVEVRPIRTTPNQRTQEDPIQQNRQGGQQQNQQQNQIPGE